MNKEKYRTFYPDKEKISKNPITKRTYCKIRDCFKWNYIGEDFTNPLQPKEEEFLQWIKKFLNEMERNLKKQGCGKRFTWAKCERHTCGEDLILPSGKKKRNYYLCKNCSQGGKDGK